MTLPNFLQTGTDSYNLVSDITTELNHVLQRLAKLLYFLQLNAMSHCM